MNKGSKKASGYILIALYVAYMALPEFIKQYPGVTWLVSLSTMAGCLWRAVDYFKMGSSEDVADKAVAATPPGALVVAPIEKDTT